VEKEKREQKKEKRNEKLEGTSQFLNLSTRKFFYLRIRMNKETEYTKTKKSQKFLLPEDSNLAQNQNSYFSGLPVEFDFDVAEFAADIEVEVAVAVEVAAKEKKKKEEEVNFAVVKRKQKKQQKEEKEKEESIFCRYFAVVFSFSGRK